MNLICRCCLFSLLVALAAASVSAEPASERHDRSRQVVREVLAGGEFVHLQQEEKLSLVQRLRLWLIQAVRWIGEVFESMPRWLWWTVLIWMVLTLLAIVGHLVYTLVTALSPRALRAAGRGEGGSFSERWLGERDLDFEELYERARQLLAEGNLTEAVRYLFVAGLMLLQRGGWVRFHRSKTDGDYLRELMGHPHIREALINLTRTFEATAYGSAAATRDQVRAMSAIVEGLTREGRGPQPR